MDLGVGESHLADIHAFFSATGASVSAIGGIGGDSLYDGGAGAIGRIRFDLPARPLASSPAATIGSTLSRPSTAVSRTKDLSLELLGDGSHPDFVISVNGTETVGHIIFTAGSQTVGVLLDEGLNRVCAYEAGTTADIAKSCIEVAYLP